MIGIELKSLVTGTMVGFRSKSWDEWDDNPTLIQNLPHVFFKDHFTFLQILIVSIFGPNFVYLLERERERELLQHSQPIFKINP